MQSNALEVVFQSQVLLGFFHFKHVYTEVVSMEVEERPSVPEADTSQ